jgi:hypothetical protein
MHIGLSEYQFHEMVAKIVQYLTIFHGKAIEKSTILQEGSVTWRCLRRDRSGASRAARVLLAFVSSNLPPLPWQSITPSAPSRDSAPFLRLFYDFESLI